MTIQDGTIEATTAEQMRAAACDWIDNLANQTDQSADIQAAKIGTSPLYLVASYLRTAAANLRAVNIEPAPDTSDIPEASPEDFARGRIISPAEAVAKLRARPNPTMTTPAAEPIKTPADIAARYAAMRSMANKWPADRSPFTASSERHAEARAAANEAAGHTLNVDDGFRIDSTTQWCGFTIKSQGRGFFVVTRDGTNPMPGATWFRSVEDAEVGIAALRLAEAIGKVKPDGEFGELPVGDAFWMLMTLAKATR